MFRREQSLLRPSRALVPAVAALTVIWIVAACSSSNGEGALAVQPTALSTPGPTAPQTAEAPPTPVPTPASRTFAPTATATRIPDHQFIGGPPSQSYEDAVRDGVLPDVATLSFADRVEIITEIEVQGQRWVLSRFPSRTRSLVSGLGSIAGSVDSGSSEILELDGETILRSIPLIGSPATWIAASDDAIYAGRVGDGGYPDTTVARINLFTGQETRLRLPFAYVRPSDPMASAWEIVTPSTAAALLQAIRDVSQQEPSAESITALNVAIDAAAVTDSSTWPRLALSRSGCVPYPIERLYDFGTHCVTETRDPATGDTAVTIADAQVAGSLVGAGWMTDSGPTFAAIVAPSADPSSGSAARLLFVDVDDPSIILDTGIDGSTEGLQVSQVSFYDGGFVTTTAVDLGSTVQGYDTELEPLSVFVSPTDEDRGYPPDPFVSHAAISPDGRHLVTAERDWPANGDGSPGQGLAIVMTDSNTGDELNRVELNLEVDQLVRWLDFDGRWAVLSFQKVATEPTESFPAALPIMIDMPTGEIFPLGINQPAIVTLERSAAP